MTATLLLQPCTTSGRESLSHVFWACPAAQTVWRRMIRRWADDSLTSTHRDAIFPCKVPPVAPRLQASFLVAAWPAMVRILMHQLWLRRNDRVYHNENDPPLAVPAQSERHIFAHMRSLADIWLLRRSTGLYELLLRHVLPVLTHPVPNAASRLHLCLHRGPNLAGAALSCSTPVSWASAHSNPLSARSKPSTRCPRPMSTDY